jgi:hypothetical protein
MAMTSGDAWVGVFGADPRSWLLTSGEAPARWVTLTALLGRPDTDDDVRSARQASVDSAMVAGLIDGLPSWGEDGGVSGHDSPAYLPNMLGFLADLGVRAGDDDQVDTALDGLCAQQYDDGRFTAFGRAPGHARPVWASLPCDTHLITDVLIRYGRADHPAVRLALQRIAVDLRTTNQGPAWTCVPDPSVGFRGPGRKGDICPQVTLEALRAFSRLPEADRPPGLEEVAGTVLGVWRDRGERQPYMFGHGVRFKTVKWPPLWYGAYGVLDTLGRYPALWRREPGVTRPALPELVACLIAYNVAPDGTITPQSAYRGFARYSFGQKRHPSPIATALLAAVVRRFSDLADDITRIDVTQLGSSKGGTGTSVPPRSRPTAQR